MIYEEIFREFEARGVRYLVVGGIAVNLYGYVRMTMDLDIMADLSSENLAKIVDGMETLGYRPRLPVKALDLISEEQRNQWIKEKGAVVFTFIHSQTAYKQIDIFLDNPVDFQTAYLNRLTMKVGDMLIPVASIDDLMHMKESAARPRDLEDLSHLKKIKDLRKGNS